MLRKQWCFVMFLVIQTTPTRQHLLTWLLINNCWNLHSAQSFLPPSLQPTKCIEKQCDRFTLLQLCSVHAQVDLWHYHWERTEWFQMPHYCLSCVRSRTSGLKWNWVQSALMQPRKAMRQCTVKSISSSVLANLIESEHRTDNNAAFGIIHRVLNGKVNEVFAWTKRIWSNGDQIIQS